MKSIRLFTAIIFSIFISVPFSFSATTEQVIPSKGSSGAKDNLVSIDLQDANLKTVLKAFSQQSGLNFIASQNVQNRTVTIYFDNVKVDEALNYIMNANNLVYEQEPGTNIFIVKESGKSGVETITKIYELKYAQLTMPAKKSASSDSSDSRGEAEIVSIIQDILSRDDKGKAIGKVIADKRSNSLIIRDVPSQFPIIEDVLARLDVKTPQVMIKVEILETTTAVVENLGIEWSGKFGVYGGPATNTIFPMNNSLGRNNSSGEGISSPGSFSLASTTATIAALLSNSNTKTLARPQILTMNNETAEININSNDTIETETTYDTVGNEAIPRVKFIRAAKDERPGITLTVTPTVSKSDFITMVIEPKLITKTVSDFSTTSSKVFDLGFRTAKTTVMVKDGETVVIGGLIKAQHERGLKKVPFLGDIPVLGAAFRYKTKDDSDKELIIFITPKIIKDTSYALGSISDREQEKPKAVREKEIKTVLDLFGG